MDPDAHSVQGVGVATAQVQDAVLGIVAGAVAGDGLLGSRKRGIRSKRSSSTTSDGLIILKPLVGKRIGRDRAL
ncbi:hypothetical protein V501_03138 [Pseudogymnoascus sp. VKM F-4519 (FW-2642)]|nr:hypothetical protein V501_03138 [Pseudogymnoascus sp. VKM F-4519 (FW-2642)]